MKEDSYDIQEYLQDYTESSPDKEIRIINAAINIFSEKGFESTRTREIAERAGIAEGTIFRYFPTKDAILERMVPLLIRVMMPRISGPIEKIIHAHEADSVEDIWFDILIDRIKMIRDNGRWDAVNMYAFLPNHAPESDGICLALKKHQRRKSI